MESDSEECKRGGLRQRVPLSSAPVFPNTGDTLLSSKEQLMAVLGKALDCSLSDVRGLQSSLEDQASTLPAVTSRRLQEATISNISTARLEAPAQHQQPGNNTERASRKLFPSAGTAAPEDHLSAAHEEV